MESKTKNRKTPGQISSLCLSAFGETALDIKEYTEGWFNAVYGITLAGGREIVLKIAPPKDIDIMTYENNMMSNEVSAMSMVREKTTIPVPEVLFYDNSKSMFDTDYFFMEKVSGVNYLHLKESLTDKQKYDIEYQMGMLNRVMNGISGSIFGYMNNPELQGDTWRKAFLKILKSVLEDGACKNISIGYEYDEILKLAKAKSSALDIVTKPCFVHWDVWDANVFAKDGKVTGIIDFERALWGDPLMEPLFRTYFMPSPALDGYGRTAFTADEEICMQLYSLHLFLIMFIESYYRQYSTDDNKIFAKNALISTVSWLREH